MDPKMDSGYVNPGETLEDNYDVLRDLLPEELIGIMDMLLCHEMAWHHGYPLSQTIFTSLYVDRMLWPEPATLEMAQFYRGVRPSGLHPFLEILRAYCLGLVRCCDYCIEKVASRDYFEEEDFSTNTFNRNLLSQVPEVQIRELIDKSVLSLEKPLDRK
jgi:N-alpha-acetyltransferase 35, NatC auxiliary subunit